MRQPPSVTAGTAGVLSCELSAPPLASWEGERLVPTGGPVASSRSAPELPGVAVDCQASRRARVTAHSRFGIYGTLSAPCATPVFFPEMFALHSLGKLIRASVFLFTPPSPSPSFPFLHQVSRWLLGSCENRRSWMETPSFIAVESGHRPAAGALPPAPLPCWSGGRHPDGLPRPRPVPARTP